MRFIIGLAFISIYPRMCFSQTPRDQYIIIYHVDTIRRLQVDPPSYIPVQLTVYTYGNLYRMELLFKNKVNSLDSNKIIEIKNEKGTYTTIEESDPFLNREIKNLYLFTPTKDTLLTQYINNFSIKKIQSTHMLKLKSLRITYIDSTDDTKEIVCTKQINIPLLSYFKFLPPSFGSALQFIDEHEGWRTKYTATIIKKVIQNSELFLLNPNHKIIPANSDENTQRH